MESERLAIPESQCKRGECSVREFVCAVAKSDLYRSRFFSNCPRYREIELNFRHLLGRAPLDLEDMWMHSTILDTEGLEAAIDSYLDSDEYQTTLGENLVPYIRGYKTEACQSMVQLTHMFHVVRGASTSSLKADLAGKSPLPEFPRHSKNNPRGYSRQHRLHIPEPTRRSPTTTGSGCYR